MIEKLRVTFTHAMPTLLHVDMNGSLVYKPLVYFGKPCNEQNEKEQNETKPESASEFTGESFKLSSTSNCLSTISRVVAGKHCEHEPS